MSFSARTSATLIGLLSVFAGATLPPPAISGPNANLVTPLSDAKNWHLQVGGKARATLKRTGSVEIITTAAVDAVPYHGLFQYSYSGPALEDGQVYTLRFRAKADTRRVLPIYALVAGGDYHGIGLRQAANLSSEWRTFEYTFLVSNRGSAAIICPQFTVGNAVGTTYLADVSLVRAAVGSAVTPPPDPPLWHLQLFDPVTASLAAEGGAQVTTITKTDGLAWHAQLERLNASVKDGVTSTVTFRARADVPRDMMLTGVVKDGDFHAICGQQYVALNTSWREYTYHITPHGSAGHPVAFPQFLLGKQSGTVWIDHLLVTSQDDSSGDSVASTAVPAFPAAPPPAVSLPAAPPALAAPLLLPRVGELRVEGVIAPDGFGPDSFTLLARRIVLPDGKKVTLPQTRRKVVRLDAQTSYRALQASDAAGFSQASLKPGDAVSVIGHDAGVGKELPARLVLR